MKTIPLTELEKEVLNNILHNEYQNYAGADAIDKAIWSFAVTNEDKKLAGALGSLCKKGLAGAHKYKGEEPCCWITKEGYELISQS